LFVSRLPSRHWFFNRFVVSPWLQEKNCVIEIMRPFTAAAVSLGVFGTDVVEAVKCGTPLTTECLGDSDIRYDADYTKYLKEQDPRWADFEGYWKAELSVVDMAGNSKPPKKLNGMVYEEHKRVGFYNHTFLGSRFIANRYYFYKPAPQDLCDEPTVNAPLLNTEGGGTCGVNGLLATGGFYAVASHENDGTMNEIRSVGVYSMFADAAPMDHPDMPSRYQVLDSGTVNNFLQMPGLLVQDSSYTFIDKDTVKVAAIFVDLFSDNPIESANLGRMTRLTEEEFVKGIEDAYVDANILPSERLPIPYDSQFYPTEEEWCNEFKDPSCSASPYKEPVASMNGGGIALIVVLCVAFVSAVFYVIYRHAKSAQKNRYKKRLISAMARNITVMPAAGQLNHEDLKAEFDRIDKDKGGTISKEELWAYITNGHMGTTSEKDFNAMWSVIDLDDSGEVDFVEFIAFLSNCGDQFEEVHDEQLQRGGLRASIRRLSSVRMLSDAENVSTATPNMTRDDIIKKASRRLSTTFTGGNAVIDEGEQGEVKQATSPSDTESKNESGQAEDV
ncbi:hypothetical protein ACHAWF_014082, partial [Thalassiosira exigua]